MTKADPVGRETRFGRFAPIVLPVLVILAARAATHTEWAATNTMLAALLFCWVVADALALGLLARHGKKGPGLRPMLGVLSAASVVILVGAAPPVRSAILAIPAIPAAMAMTVATYVVWSAARAVRTWHRTADLETALGEILPPRLIRFARLELRVLSLALFRWNVPADVPAGASAHAYHRFLTPMLATLLGLQLIELGVMHLLLMLWNPVVAWIALALSVWGVIWITALLKSLRIHPVLVTQTGLRVRFGMLTDVEVPFTAIGRRLAVVSPEQARARTTLNTAILSSPNVAFALTHPIDVPDFLGRSRPITLVAMRLDDSAAFLHAIEKRLA